MPRSQILKASLAERIQSVIGNFFGVLSLASDQRIISWHKDKGRDANR